MHIKLWLWGSLSVAVFKVNWEYKWVDGEALDAIFMRAALALL